MAELALEALFSAQSARAQDAESVLRWQWLRLAMGGLLAGTWLIFGLSFARANSQVFLRRWRAAVAFGFAVPSLLSLAFRDALFLYASERTGGWLLRLGWAGQPAA